MNSSYHTPVLFDSVIAGLNIEKGQWYVDCTLGGGSYSAGILSQGGNVVGIDTDTEAINHTRQRFVEEFTQLSEGKEWLLIHDNFRNVEKILTTVSITPAGILMDLGVSSHQLDSKERGFSYRYPEEELDMRLDQTQGIPAYEIVNTRTKEELYDIITKFGEEERAISIVHALLVARRIKPIRTIGDVMKAIEKSVPNDKAGTFSRVFQALRIEVNDELGALKEGLEGIKHILPTGGRLCIISFHSLEDRIAKRFIKDSGWLELGDMVRADQNEQMRNRRSRSAKLRVAQKI